MMMNKSSKHRRNLSCDRYFLILYNNSAYGVLKIAQFENTS
jgi:hypothetical protein